MLIVGAKGFAKELLEVIIQGNLGAKITFYDDVSEYLPKLLFGKYSILRACLEIQKRSAETVNLFVR